MFSSSNALPCSIFDNIADAKLISTLRSGKSAFYLLIIQSFLNFPLLPCICSAERIRRIDGNGLILKIFHFTFDMSNN